MNENIITSKKKHFYQLICRVALFATVWILIWRIGAYILYSISDLAAWNWYQGIKGLPIAILIWLLLEITIFATVSNRINWFFRIVIASVFLYWPILQIVLMIVY